MTGDERARSLPTGNHRGCPVSPLPMRAMRRQVAHCARIRAYGPNGPITSSIHIHIGEPAVAVLTSPYARSGLDNIGIWRGASLGGWGAADRDPRFHRPQHPLAIGREIWPRRYSDSSFPSAPRCGIRILGDRPERPSEFPLIFLAGRRGRARAAGGGSLGRPGGSRAYRTDQLRPGSLPPPSAPPNIRRFKIWRLPDGRSVVITLAHFQPRKRPAVEIYLRHPDGESRRIR